jgi:hypothetical protein
MLSPATFIGIAKATAPISQPKPAPAATVQPVRVLGTLQTAAPVGQSLPKPAATASPGTATSPPRNLPRGSLLDLSV